MLIGNWLVAVVVPSSVAFEQYSVSIGVTCQVIKVSGAGVRHGQVCSHAVQCRQWCRCRRAGLQLRSSVVSGTGAVVQVCITQFFVGCVLMLEDQQCVRNLNFL